MWATRIDRIDEQGPRNELFLGEFEKKIPFPSSLLDTKNTFY